MVTVRVPATSANLGSGFDTLGIALSLYNTFTFEEIPAGLEFKGFLPEFENEQNLVYQSMLPIFEKFAQKPAGVRISVTEEIPVSRGLGSSAVCIVAGLMGAAAILQKDVSKEEIFQIASTIEGHPDNVAPAVFGGLTVSIKGEEQFFTQIVEVAEGVSFVALVPDVRLSTKAAREVLPAEIAYRKAVGNIGNAAILPWVLHRGNFEMLSSCLQDQLHEPYRAPLMPDFYKVISTAETLGAYGTYLSGAGSTIMALVPSNQVDFYEKMADALKNLENQWDVKVLQIDHTGASLI